MKNKVKIAVLDSYVRTDKILFKNSIHISSFGKYYDEKNYLHGTIVCSQILNECKNVDIVVFPVFYDDCNADIGDIIRVLNMIKEDGSYNLINMSFGFIDSENIKEIETICEELYKEGIIVVAAFDNNGLMSYPAVFNTVIGVDICSQSDIVSDYKYVEGSIVNIIGNNRVKRVRLKEENLFVNGTSFFVPLIVGKIANFIISNDFQYDISKVMQFLKNNASEIINEERKDIRINQDIDIQKAIVLPINKENYSLIRFAEELDFEIIDFYDFKQLLRVGMPISTVIHSDKYGDKIIKSIEKIDWTKEFDTVIIGHLEMISKLIPKDIILELLHECKAHNKKVITYSNYIFKKYVKKNESLHDLKMLYTEITKSYVPQGRFGKLWYISKPIIEVLSTRTKTGKFSAQIMLRKKMISKGYKVGFLSTEPQGILFNADKVFPYGYNSSVKLETNDYVSVINEMLHEIDQTQPDIILTGGQSGILSYDLYNTSRILIPQLAFHYGINPDCVLLCINCDDEMEYIERTIKFVESCSETRVVALIMFPIVKEMRGVGCFVDKNIINTESYIQKIEEIKKKFNLPVFENNENSMGKCVDFLIDFLS